MNEKKHAWFFMNRYIAPKDFETKMEALAAQGWQVDAIGAMSTVRLTFHKRAPEKYKYVLDFRFFAWKSYFTKFRAEGWEYLGRASNCFIWRKQYSEGKPDSFLSKEGERSRDKKIFYTIFMPFILLAVMLFFSLGAVATRPDSVDLTEMLIVAVVSLVGDVYLGWALLKMRAAMERNR